MRNVAEEHSNKCWVGERTWIDDGIYRGHAPACPNAVGLAIHIHLSSLALTQILRAETPAVAAAAFASG